MRRWNRLVARAMDRATGRSYRLAKASFSLRLRDPLRTNPVIVHSVGKVGSTSLLATLRAAVGGRPVWHVHWLDEENLRRDEAYYRERARDYRGTARMDRFFPRYDWRGERLARAIRSAPPDHRWDVVTVVRDPVDRNVSAFFQNLELMFDYWPADQLRTRSPREIAAELVEYFLASYVADAPPRDRDGDPLTWFDRELRPVFGVDVFASPFAKSRGYQIYSSTTARVLLLRLEDLDTVASSAFAEFFGIDVPRVLARNEAATKEYADAYRLFQEQLQLPSEFLDRMYGSRYSRHFYTSEELERFRSRWSRPGALGRRS
jgi:Putative capsular polysaccharide synthesis protein